MMSLILVLFGHQQQYTHTHNKHVQSDPYELSMLSAPQKGHMGQNSFDTG